jgi:hypothetical protein
MTDADRLKEFARSYQRLRQLQKAFFRAKTDDNLRAAKKAEKELDGEANQILNFTTPSLFDRDGGTDGDANTAHV